MVHQDGSRDLAGRPADARPDRDDGRCDEHDLLAAAATTSITAKAGEKVDKVRLTQVGRALQRLGLEHIPAYSPEARGRSDRMFSTLQDRLPKELKRGGQWLHGRVLFYLPAHKARFARSPEIADSAVVTADPAQLAEILWWRKSAWSAATTPLSSDGSGCSCRQARSAITSSRPRSRCANTRTARWPSSTGHGRSPATMQMGRCGQQTEIRSGGVNRFQRRSCNKQKRTSDVLQNPDNLKSCRQGFPVF